MKLKFLLGLTILSLIAVLFIDPIPQWPEYHSFADQRVIFGIANFYNVASSLVYVVLGVYCLMQTRPAIGYEKTFNSLLAPRIFFLALALTGIGSVFYHLNPNNATLFWDRLPMTVTFMAFFSYVLSVTFKSPIVNRLLFPLLAFGIVSVVYWYMTETNGRGDLRFYGIVQFLPMLLIPLILLMYKPKQRVYLWGVVFIYGCAKIAELLDTQLMAYLFFSGHTYKHIISASASLILLKAIRVPKA